jgi:hypothetical protein
MSFIAPRDEGVDYGDVADLRETVLRNTHLLIEDEKRHVSSRRVTPVETPAYAFAAKSYAELQVSLRPKTYL